MSGSKSGPEEYDGNGLHVKDNDDAGTAQDKEKTKTERGEGEELDQDVPTRGKTSCRLHHRGNKTRQDRMHEEKITTARTLVRTE